MMRPAADRHPSSLIRASAGTGKTFRLAMRYIGLLHRDEPPASLLASTFTRKAAGEMLDRVMKLLAEGATDPEKLKDLQVNAALDITQARCAELLRTVLQAIPHLNVHNIDKLFLRLAKGFSLELGVAPGWQIAEETDEDAMKVDAIAALLREPPEGVDLVATLRAFAGGGNPRSVHNALLKRLNGLYDGFCGTQGAAGPWNFIAPPKTRLGTTELAAGIAALRAREDVLPLTQKKSPDLRWRKAFDKSLEFAENADWAGFCTQALVQAARLPPPDDTFYNKELPPRLHAAYQPLIDHAIALLVEELRQRNIAAHTLLTGFDQHFKRIKAERGQYRFDDIPRMLLNLEWAGQRDHIYYRLDARVRHIMLDEFQDTSLMQFQLFRPLVEECLSSDDGRTAFAVGDVKQSLYRFRNADPDLLATLEKALAFKEIEELKDNYRSSPAVIAAVNEVFADPRENAALQGKPIAVEAASAWHGSYVAHVANRKDFPGTVILRTCESDDPKGSSEEELAACVAQRAAALHASCPQASIAVLFRSRKAIPTVRHELRQLGVDTSEEGGSNITDSPAVGAVVSLLQLAAYPGDTLAIFHLVHTPLGPALGLTDYTDLRAAGRVSTRVRSACLSRGFAALCRKLRRDLLPFITARDHDRLGQLIDVATAQDANGMHDILAFKTCIEQTRREDPTPARVRLMTIHASKGLEFDAVLLPQFDGAWSVKDRVLCRKSSSPTEVPHLLTLPPGGELAGICPDLQALNDDSYRNMIRDEFCCTYVAMTRAIHHLEIVVRAEPPRADKTPRSPSADRFLCAALAPHMERAAATILYESDHGEGSWQEWVARHSTPAAPPPPTVTLTMAPGRNADPLRARRASPSSLEGGGESQATDLLKARHEASLSRGTLIHAWFECVTFTGEPEPDDTSLLAAAARAGFTADVALQLVPEFRSMLAQEAVRNAMTRPAAEVVKLKREWAFSTPVEQDGRVLLLEGRFDRVVIQYRDGKPVGAEILDFKTDDIALEEIPVRASHYAPQMQAYRAALAVLLGVNADVIRASLLFVSVGTAVAIGPTDAC